MRVEQLWAERVGGEVRRCVPGSRPTSAPSLGRAHVRSDQQLAPAICPRRELDIDGNDATARVQVSSRACGCEIAAVEGTGGVALPAPLDDERWASQTDRGRHRGGEGNREVPSHRELRPVREELCEVLVVHAFMMDGTCFMVGTPRRQADEANMATV